MQSFPRDAVSRQCYQPILSFNKKKKKNSSVSIIHLATSCAMDKVHRFTTNHNSLTQRLTDVTEVVFRIFRLSPLISFLNRLQIYTG